MVLRNSSMALLVLVLGIGIGCSDTRRAENAPADTPAASADRADRSDTDWTRERDEYITRRERELEEVDSRWENFKDKTSAKSRAAWNEVKEESAELRRELRQLRGESRETWQESKRRIDAGWDRFQAKVRDIFGDNDRPNR